MNANFRPSATDRVDGLLDPVQVAREAGDENPAFGLVDEICDSHTDRLLRIHHTWAAQRWSSRPGAAERRGAQNRRNSVGRSMTPSIGVGSSLKSPAVRR